MVKKKKSVAAPHKTSQKKLTDNPWAVGCIVLAIILLAILFKGGGLSSSTSTQVSADEVSARVLSFIENQGATAEIVSVTEDGELYEVVVSVQGQQVPVYVTKDGNNLIPTIVPLGGGSVDSATAPSTAPAPTNIPTSEKPDVELYVMSICPYGTQMEKGLLPVLDTLGDKIDFELKFVYYAMHDKPEVDENTVQYCVQKEYGRQKLQEYLYCYLQEQDPSVWNACIAKLNMEPRTIETCVAAADAEFGITAAFNDKASWLSGRFPIYPVHQEDNQANSVGGSPTLIINGVEAQSARDPASLLATVCAAFTEKPAECDTQLDSSAYNPGFGFSRTPTSASAAACGAY